MQDIWLEKYRPKTLDQVKGNKEILSQFKCIIEDGSIPNMILTGPPGCGKTSSVLCIAREILKENFSKAVIELNASDERGIDVVRSKIKEFAQLKVRIPENAHKIVILDEADSLTTNAQQAMRMIISDFSDSTRFVFACNDSSKIIEPIQSRCVILRFSRLSDQDILEKIKEICALENVAYDNSGLEAIIFSAEGDMRTAINNLQATAVGAKKVTREKVFEICDIPDIETLQRIVGFCKDANREQAFIQMKKLWDQSFTAYDLINNIGKVIESQKLDVDLLFEYIDEVSSLKVRVLQGVNSLVQLFAFLSRLCDISERHARKK